MPLNAATGQPLYRQVAGEIRQGVESGKYPPGARLPSEPELMDRYQVSRNTVRLALELLREEGLVVTGQGRGSFVVERAPAPLESGSEEPEGREDVVRNSDACRARSAHLRSRNDEQAAPDGSPLDRPHRRWSRHHPTTHIAEGARATASALTRTLPVSVTSACAYP